MVELGVLGFVFVIILFTSLSNIGALLGSMINPLLWVGVFASFNIVKTYHNDNKTIIYLYVILFSVLLRFIDIKFLSPITGGFSPNITIYRLLWPVLSMLTLTAVIIGIRKLKQK